MSAVYRGLGRRKSSIARVEIIDGTGKILINNKTPEEYFPNKIVIQDAELPLAVTELKDKFDVRVKVIGGGFTGQAGAIKLGLARALLQVNGDLKPKLKEQKLTTRDSRSKERKKVGKYGARRSPQFSKR